MKQAPAYRTEKEKLSEGRMQFWVLNRCPQYPAGQDAKENIKVRAQVEQQLFAAFEQQQESSRR